jgi:hypothetical protein
MAVSADGTDATCPGPCPSCDTAADKAGTALPARMPLPCDMYICRGAELGRRPAAAELPLVLLATPGCAPPDAVAACWAVPGLK